MDSTTPLIDSPAAEPSVALSYRSLFENAVEGIYRTTPEGQYLAANPALARIYGYESAQQLIDELVDIAGSLYVDPFDRDRFTRALAAADSVLNFEACVYRRDGSIIWICENARVVRGPDGRVRCYEGTVQDITQRKLAEERLRLAATVFDTADEAIVITGTDDRVQAANPAFERMTGWTAAEMADRPCPLIAAEMNDSALLTTMRETAAAGSPWHGEILARRKSGEVFPALVSFTGVAGDNGLAHSFVLLARDITRRKIDEQRIRYQASHDTLTRLINRPTLMATLSDTLDRARPEGKRTLVLFLDINRLKDVNDTFGHAAGDELLREVSIRIKAGTGTHDTVGRIGGDEFVIVIPNAAGRETAQTTLQKLLYAFSEPMRIAHRELFASITIGLAMSPDDGVTAEELLSNADAAMYHARKIGSAYSFYDPDMSHQALERLVLEGDLRQALSRGEFRMHYQPKVNAHTGQIRGAEALIRWQHRERGNVSPALFIPIAERAGLIGTIGEWTLREACEAFRRWTHAGCAPTTVSVNLSPAQFRDPRLPDIVANALDDCGLPPSVLDLEITETMMASEVERAITLLDDFRRLGVSLSIDDFGTGYSSLSYLKVFPVNTLKIDRAFIRDLPGSDKDGAIISSIVALAGNLGFDVVAEGVETDDQAECLLGRGCNLMQGFLFSPALPEGAFMDMLKMGPLHRQTLARAT
ncbi:MAG TPA: EAL domain-containing protein [Azospirillaceae bacterium]|nr:EAL domain-containing protein [Azospirillaceae bacterium]